MDFNFQNIVSDLLTEGKRDEMLAVYLPLFKKRKKDITLSQLKQALLKKFVNEGYFHSLSLDSNFYLAGVARYYFNGDLTTNVRLGIFQFNTDENGQLVFKQDHFNEAVCERLDALILDFRNAYVDSVGTKWVQPEDFGTLSCEKLLTKYAKRIDKALGLDKEEEKTDEVQEISQDYTCGNYTYEIMYSQDDCKQFEKYTRPGAWCITYGQVHYDNYINSFKRKGYGGIHYVIFLRNDYKETPRIKGEGYPRDNYGKSMIAVLQRNDCPEPTYITSRWNHGGYDSPSCEADHAFSKGEFLQTIGDNGEVLQRCYDQWKATYEAEKKELEKANNDISKKELVRSFKYAQMLLNGGKNPEEVFAYTYQNYDGETREAYNIVYITGTQKGYKGTYKVGLRINDETFYTLMDRKILYYDVFLVKDENYYHGSTKKYLNIVKCKRNNDTFSLFDLIHHQFISVDGIKSFKYTDENSSYRDDEKSPYIRVGVRGNQWMLLNRETCKVVKTPRGNSWFESIMQVDENHADMVDYNGHIHYMSEITNDDILQMVYDSSSQESYAFSVSEGKFITPNDNSEGYVPYINFDNSLLKKLNLCIYTKKINDFEGTRGNIYRLLNLKTKEWFPMLNIKDFKNINVDEDFIIIRFLDYEYSVLYDLKNNKWLTLGGKIVKSSEDYLYNNPFLKIPLYNSHGVSLLLDTKTHKIFNDNISGYFFKCFEFSNLVQHYGLWAYLPKHINPQEAKNMGYEIKTVADRYKGYKWHTITQEEENTYIYFIKVKCSYYESKKTYRLNDLKSMLYEAINLLKNK